MGDDNISVIKYFFTILCSFFLFKKLLNIQIKFKYLVIDFFLSAVLAAVMHFVNQYISGAVFVAVVLFCVLSSLIHKKALNISLMTGIIAFGLAHIASFLAATISMSTSFVLVIIFGERGARPLYYLVTGAIQLIFAAIPFLFSRLKKGMTYLQKGEAGSFGAVVSVLLLLATSLLTSHPGNDIRVPIYDVVAAEGGFVLILWWRSKLLFHFWDKTRQKQIQDLEEENQHLHDENTSLEQDNAKLAKILHTHGKVLAAMQDIATQVLQLSDYPDEVQRKEIEKLRKYFDSIVEEHANVLFAYRNHNKRFQKTDVLGVDSIISYMGQRAYENGVNFDFTSTGSIQHFVETQINEIDLAKLLTDLIGNAIIAERDTEEKNILVYICVLDLHYVIDVSDSGIPFGADTIAKLGRQRVTTHAETGGSGYGMDIIFEILRKYNASFVIDDTGQGGPFTKKISIRFDGLAQFRVRTERQEIQALRETRPDIIWV